MTVRGIDDEHVEPGGEEGLGALDAVDAGAGRGGDPQAAMLVLAGHRIALRLLDILDGDQPDAAIGFVDDQQLFDAVMVQAGAWPHRARRSRGP